MDKKENILENLKTLRKFEPMSPKKVYHVNTLTTYGTMAEILKLVSKKNQFVIETKYDDMNGCPKLIQILFSHRFILYIILVETLYLPEFDLCLHHQIKCLFSTILSPSNEIQSWKNIKIELKYFLDCNIFSWTQIENVQVVNIQRKFQEWFRKFFVNIQLNYVPSNSWTLEMAIAFLFQEQLDTSPAKSRNWNIGLFAHFNTNCNERLIADRFVLNILADNKSRSILGNYAIHECMAVNRIAALLQNDWTRKNGEKYLKKYYNNS
jgi:hypothetical protein